MLVTNKFAFYHIPRTGGNSIEYTLNFHPVFEYPPSLRVGPVHAPLSVQPVNIEDYDIFTNIRNPFDRLVSLYELIKADRVFFTKFEGDVTFEQFIYDHWGKHLNNANEYHTQEEHLFVDGKLPENVTLIKTEEMNERWAKILREYFQLDVRIKIPHRNAVKHSEPMTYYNEDLIKFVTKREEWVLQFYE